jgi:hypothetical protein
LAEWADVYVADTDDRIALQGKALFFIPLALQVLNTVGINVSTLTHRSAILRGNPQRGSFKVAGRNAISKVMDCEPVVYDSALGFINVANAELEARGDSQRLTKATIVACVFELERIGEVFEALGLSEATVATDCGIQERIVRAACQRGRLQFVHADLIWKKCLAAKRGCRPECGWNSVARSPVT